ncbi:glycosyltransferase family 2 protein [Mangrovimonas cancribranchiae]|uniref:Glycosyltransferase family 2 protein n=1 Tax=Mangrovimonas cancribranchiae TaxID=3080055 RepID=A0AAU6P160_9FLAO
MPDHPLVSIIIPTYNRAHLIGETLDSVLVQTYQNWECIVVDDGSTDNTEDVLKQYTQKDSRIKYLHRPQEHLPGGNGARNYGFKLSKGKYVQWFDSDDLMFKNMLEDKIQQAIKYQADIVVAKHTVQEQKALKKEELQPKVFNSAEFYIDYILGKYPMITNDVLIKREVVKEHRFDERLHKAQEFEFFSRLFQQKLTYCFLNKELVWYRTTADSISNRNGKHWIKKQESLIYLSKKLQSQYVTNQEIVAKAQRQGRKTYKNLILSKHLSVVFKHFQFFKTCHKKNSGVFLGYILYNTLTKRGFDKIKP